ncbi:MAG: hypothetical protein GF341_04755 [candidate division Zixibacteria bacterium]|nr:hypothetical protein [candidate division Zixibacteria bacterium]
MTTPFYTTTGEPITQPLSDRGWRYHAPMSRNDRTYWLRDDEQRHYSTQAVADELGIPLSEIVAWEQAIDLGAEAEARADGDGW